MNGDAGVEVVGVDGCKGGWIAARQGPASPVGIEVFLSFKALVESVSDTAVIAVDMPIGLPARNGQGGRGPEALVRPLLGMRQSSVFSIPSRSAVYASTEPFTTLDAWYEAHRVASAVARATSDPPRGVSIQAFGIFAKIRELDTVLKSDPALCSRIVESHPELAFCRLNGGRPMALPKKIKGSIHFPGMAERIDLLAAQGIDRALLTRAPPAGAGRDDMLDACAMLLIARRHARGETVSYPDAPARDEYGLPVAIRV